MTRALPLLVLCAVLGAAAPARAEDCTHALTVRDGKAHDPDTGAVVPLCDGDLLPTADVLWLLQREGRATEAVSALELAAQELAAERDMHKVDVDRLAAELEAQREARLACERERAPAPERRAFYESPWFGGAVGAFVASGLIVGLVIAVR